MNVMHPLKPDTNLALHVNENAMKELQCALQRGFNTLHSAMDICTEIDKRNRKIDADVDEGSAEDTASANGSHSSSTSSSKADVGMRFVNMLLKRTHEVSLNQDQQINVNIPISATMKEFEPEPIDSVIHHAELIMGSKVRHHRVKILSIIALILFDRDFSFQLFILISCFLDHSRCSGKSDCAHCGTAWTSSYRRNREIVARGHWQSK